MAPSTLQYSRFGPSGCAGSAMTVAICAEVILTPPLGKPISAGAIARFASPAQPFAFCAEAGVERHMPDAIAAAPVNNTAWTVRIFIARALLRHRCRNLGENQPRGRSPPQWYTKSTLAGRRW